MTHRSDAMQARSGLPIFIIALVLVLMIGVIWTLVLGSGGSDGDPTAAPATEATDGTEPTSPDATTGTSEVTSDSTTGSTEAVPVVDLPPVKGFRFEVVAEGLQQPTAVASPPGSARLFVTERVGRIKIIEPDRTMVEESFLNLTDRAVANGIEQGLLGLAFHPDYETNGRFFVYYTRKSDDGSAWRTLSEFRVSVASADQANRSSERILFSEPQPEGSTDIRHYGGALDFGPDGYLWVTVGDGADSRDQGQDPGTIFGALLRLDVDADEEPYGIPADNPFVAGGGAPEVWAYGLRNPWRFTVDDVTRTVYIGDVGQGAREEINILSIDSDAGANLGWANVEGTMCFFEKDCEPSDYFLPTIEYDHDKGCSVTGGVVYRGSEIPELDGYYFYGDWCKQWLESFLLVDGVPTDVRDWNAEYTTAGPEGSGLGQPNGFGNDGTGELYVATFGGSILTLVADR